MLVFVDESGDTGLDVEKGASPFFTVGMVIFTENEEAQALENRIIRLRQELGYAADWEFHFRENSDSVRQAFFEAVAPFNFVYLGFVVNKVELYREGFKKKDIFYKFVCKMIFENVSEYLNNAIVKMDKCGDRDFQRQLEAYLKRHINTDIQEKRIKKIVAQDSSKNDLLQLADMVCGAVARSYRLERKNSGVYRKMISHREISVRFWPEKRGEVF